MRLHCSAFPQLRHEVTLPTMELKTGLVEGWVVRLAQRRIRSRRSLTPIILPLLELRDEYFHPEARTRACRESVLTQRNESAMGNIAACNHVQSPPEQLLLMHRSPSCRDPRCPGG